MRINANNAVIRPYFALQNSHGHAKEFIRNLEKIWTRALKKVRQPCSRLTPCY
jgi:hypothetical protein